MQPLETLLEKIQLLSPAVRILPRLLHLLGDPDADSGDVVRLLKYDPSLTAQLLRLCNSACFATSQKVDNLDEAVTRLGYQQIYRLVTRICCETALSSPQSGYGIDPGELWRHSVVTAVVGTAIADRTGEDRNLAFTAGLLHDVGKMALSEMLASQYTRLIEQIEVRQQSFLEAEKEMFGFDHAEVGGSLLQKWEFSENLVAAVRHHHQPCDAGVHQGLAANACLANTIAHFLGHGYGHHAFALRGHSEALEMLHLGEEDIATLMIDSTERLDAEQQLLKIKL